MGIESKDIRRLVSEGVSFVCAMCDHWWWSHGRGLAVCRAAVESRECSGPIGGLCYPEYSGPLKRNLVRFCFRCGAQSIAAVEVFGKGMCGVCGEHMEMLETYGKLGDKPRFVTHNYVPVVEG